MKVVVIGAGAVGSRAARQLAAIDSVRTVVLVDDDFDKANRVAESIGSIVNPIGIPTLWPEARRKRVAEACAGAQAVVLTGQRDQIEFAEIAIRSKTHVVSVSDDLDCVMGLLCLDELAKEAGRSLVVGAGFSPGLSCVLAMHAAREFDHVTEIRIAKTGTGGPACARQHHRALRSTGLALQQFKWTQHAGGTGRELCWFPDPVGGLDCYYAELPDPKLLQPAFEDVGDISARVSATRRDQATKWLPMMRRPHPEGLIGAIRVELRGRKDDLPKSVLYGALDRPAVAAATLAVAITRLAMRNELRGAGAGGVATMVTQTVPLLAMLHEQGVKAAVFEGRS